MNDTAIKVENISKRYRIGTREEGYKTLREAIMDGFAAPIRNFKRLRKLTKFDDAERQATSTKHHAHSAMPPSQDDVIWALKDISFEVKQGEVLGIIGRNGAGKSTLLKILSRITEPTAGQIIINGRVGSLLEVGTGFHPELTGRENIYLNGAILGMRKSEMDGKLDEIIDFAEIEKFIDTPVKRYSSGMYVRLAFAVAAHLEPEILLVDEVLAVGDVQFQKKCLGKMKSITGEGRTVLFVSHNMGQIANLCNRVMLINDGSIIRDGDSNAVVEEYIRSSISVINNKSNSGNILESEYVTLKSLSIYGEDADALPKTGKPLNIELLFDFKIPITSPGVRVFIRTLQGVELLYLTSTPFGGLVVEKAEGKIRFKLSIDELLLTAGQYVLAVGVNRVGQADYLPLREACQFEVSPNDYYSVGIHLINTKVGLMAARHKWSFQKED